MTATGALTELLDELPREDVTVERVEDKLVDGEEDAAVELELGTGISSVLTTGRFAAGVLDEELVLLELLDVIKVAEVNDVDDDEDDKEEDETVESSAAASARDNKATKATIGGCMTDRACPNETSDLSEGVKIGLSN